MQHPYYLLATERRKPCMTNCSLLRRQLCSSATLLTIKERRKYKEIVLKNDMINKKRKLKRPGAEKIGRLVDNTSCLQQRNAYCSMSRKSQSYRISELFPCIFYVLDKSFIVNNVTELHSCLRRRLQTNCMHVTILSSIVYRGDKRSSQGHSVSV